jgi:hypothetical protein
MSFVLSEFHIGYECTAFFLVGTSNAGCTELDAYRRFIVLCSHGVNVSIHHSTDRNPIFYDINEGIRILWIMPLILHSF